MEMVRQGMDSIGQSAAAAPEHDGLDPFAALTRGHAQAERACVASYERLAKLVSVV